jgi:hypothetical protein
VNQVTALLHILARYVVEPDPPNIVEALIPAAVSLSGELLARGDDARSLWRVRRTAESISEADVQEDASLILTAPRLQTVITEAVEAQRAQLIAERTQLRLRLTDAGEAPPAWLQGIDQLTIGSYDLLSITLLYPALQ